jgi:hypothetical protein
MMEAKFKKKGFEKVLHVKSYIFVQCIQEEDGVESRLHTKSIVSIGIFHLINIIFNAY